ncbi:PTS sugar transporter subunit IIA [Agreia sp. COWG]|uniref:PTS sugar transporter subunit IIA n=1 Tax=Agreia sp. COWG TaxID=2773266 RepID=UPI0019264F2C|nr:PTS sugar transporter subunit IIA [Agreia sp. COWG]
MSDNVLNLESISVGGTATTKEDAIREAAAILVKARAVTPEYVGYMLERETSVSTYMGNFLAIPHGTNEGKDTILSSGLSFVRYDTPIDWEGNEVRFVVGIAGKDNGHLDILSKIAIIFSDEDDVQRLLDAPDRDALYALLSEVNE